ncbi:MAG: hypothetical protein CVU56_27650 [Deltaproteobacteria bacterium HGW-Deltaproteobacteria-14]|jgi:nitrogenase molybdenum-iron protein alpha/beta subunit|nr:MAG: hypothetical protein CVU56_27650 [Deltaproteobacteria bacterium HGW-Deltaproteobacteria-14]
MSFGAMTFQASASLGAIIAGLAIDDAVAVLHGGAGCDIKLHVLLHEHAPGGAVHRRLICTKIHEDELVFDPGETLAQAIKDMSGRLDAQMAVVSTATFIEISGLDRDHVMDQLAALVDIPAVYVYAPDVDGDMFLGYERALTSIVKYFVGRVEPRPEDVRAKRVNLIGYFLDRQGAEHRANIKAAAAMLEALGLALNVTLLDGSPAARLYDLGDAELNVAFPLGVKAAKVLARKLDQRTLELAPPIGTANTATFIRALAAEFGAVDAGEAYIAREERRVGQRVREACAPLVGLRVAAFADGERLAGLLGICRDLRMVPVIAGCLDGRPEHIDTELWPDVDVLAEPSLNETARRLRRAVDEADVDLVIGSQHEVDMGAQVGLKGVEFGFPCKRYQALVEMPYWGYDGVLTLAQRTLEQL